MPTFTAQELHGMATNILLAAGADERNATRVADGLVLSDLSGVATHGVHQLPGYVSGIRDGYLLPTAWPEIISETPTSAQVSGNWGFGFAAAKYAMEIAIRKAKEQSVAVVGIVQVNHIGRLGEYTEMAASEGMVSFLWAGGYSEEEPTTVPYGGREKLLHTNPLSIGFPAGQEPPMMMDFATTAVAGSKVVLARNRDQKLPPGSIVDRDGRPTTDPADYFDGGSQLPFGGHKGYALMLAAEFLGRVFTGSDRYADAQRGGKYMRHQGIAIVAFKADLFEPMAEFARRADEMERRVRAVPPAPGFREVLVPGDLETRARAAQRREGITISDDIWKELTDLAASMGVSIG